MIADRVPDLDELERLLAAVAVRPMVETEHGTFDASDKDLPLDFSNEDWAKISAALGVRDKAVAKYTAAAANALPALIRRLREAEAHAAVGAEFDDCLDENERLRARIAQLERVREAVSKWRTIPGGTLHESEVMAAMRGIFAAMDALEQPVKP